MTNIAFQVNPFPLSKLTLPPSPEIQAKSNQGQDATGGGAVAFHA